MRDKTPPSLWSLSSARFRMAILLGVAMTALAVVRGSMSMAVVCMVKPLDTFNATDSHSVRPAVGCALSRQEDGEWWEEEEEEEVVKYTTTYQVAWSGAEQSQIHTAFYVGSVGSVFLADVFSKKLGSKNIILYCLLLNVVLSAATPLLVIYLEHYMIVAAVRFLIGFATGFLIPCGSEIIARWFPVAEKSTAMAIFTTGNQLGIAVSMWLTAKMCEMELFGGWPVSFYLYGVIALLTTIWWQRSAASKPRESRSISAIELEHIQGKRRRTQSISLPTPWKKMVLSPVVIAICLCSFAQSFVLISLITYLPKYNQMALGMNINKNGVMSAIPFFVQMIGKLVFGVVADWIKSKRISATIVTKTANAIASFGAAVCILLVPFVGCSSPVLAVALICAAMGLFSGYVPGYNTSLVCVAPQFTAALSAYAQFYSQLASAASPLLVGVMTQNDTLAEWDSVFYMLAGVLLVSGAAFQAFGHGRAERWGEPPSTHSSTAGESVTMDVESALLRYNEELRKDRLDCQVPRVKKVSYSMDGAVHMAQLRQLENDVIAD